MIDGKVLDAENEVEVKRAKLMTSIKFGIGEAKRRLAPDLLAEQAWEKTKAKASESAQEAVVAVKNNPAIVGGIGAAIGLYLARGPLGQMLRELWDKFFGEVIDQPEQERQPPPHDTPVAVAEQAKRRKAAANKATTASKKKTEDVK